MPHIFTYLFKLSLSLGVVFLFYQFVLRRLTFYNWNRWYLLGYSLLVFFLPFVDISFALEQSEIEQSQVINWVPVIGSRFIYVNTSPATAGISAWEYVLLILAAGSLIMLLRLGSQLFSIHRLRRKATLLNQEGMRLYQVDAAIIPFSFGNSIFINTEQHNSDELEEIIRHEFVHVRQNHSVDMIWSELLCLLNWYNPFAWLLKKSIRQNLEYIADRQVLEQGMDRKQYQYLLLKVIGNNQFSIANQFNFSSLKKRIAMMNKLRSAKIHLVKFLFMLPLLSVLLLAFRNNWKDSVSSGNKALSRLSSPEPGSVSDTIPDKVMTAPSPPPPSAPDGSPMKEFMKRNPDVKEAGWVFRQDNTVAIFHLTKKDGTVERINVESVKEREDAEKKYGPLPYPPPPPPAPAAPGAIEVAGLPLSPAPPAPAGKVVAGMPLIPPPPPPAQGGILVLGYPAAPKLPENVESIEISNGKARVSLKNGTVEQYDFSVPAEKKAFEKKYGTPPPPPPPPPAPVKGVRVEGHKLNGSAGSVVVEGKPLPDNLIYVIDGIISTKYEMEKISPDKIASVDILKGDAAVAVYGENAREGVVQVKLKYNALPLYVINGEISTREAMDKLKPELIESVDVLKGEKATAAYGDQGKNGVLLIRTKK